jgi:hypothetical protein
MLKKDDTPRPSKSEEQLKALKSEFDSLRSHLTCKICDRLLYQPYTIACGHTYCYTVRRTSLQHTPRSLTCHSVSARGSSATRLARHVPTVALSSRTRPPLPM